MLTIDQTLQGTKEALLVLITLHYSFSHVMFLMFIKICPMANFPSFPISKQTRHDHQEEKRWKEDEITEREIHRV